MLNPSRLVLARKRRRMTLMKLEQLSGVSVRSITAFENGHKEPSAESLKALAHALGFSVEFLEADSTLEIPAERASFRARSKMTALDRDAALAAGSIAVELNRWLEVRFKLPDPALPTLSNETPEEAAERVRALWGLGEAPVPNMVHLLESKGVRVFSLPIDCTEVDAFSMNGDNATPFIFLNIKKSGERGRFDAAHELGHLVLHSDHKIPHGQDAEIEAQQFASAFLMPRSGIIAQSLHNATIPRLLSAKRKWGVAAMAMAYRLHDLGLLTEWGYRSTAKQLSQMGYRSAEPGGIEREGSQLLTKAFSAMRSQKIPVSQMAEDLFLDVEALNSYAFNLAPIALNGGQQSTAPLRPALRLVKSVGR